MKLLYLLLAALPLSMACSCLAPECGTTQPFKCQCENEAAIKCGEACNFKPVLQKCGKKPPICGSRGLPPCPASRPNCVNTPEQLADGCTTAADCPGYCVKFGEFCGGFAGLPCEGKGETCVDDPRDDCDPLQGGADCGGVCVKF